MKIMLVDDSVAMRRIQRNVLGKLGLSDIVEAVDGVDALEQLKNIEVDLVVLDINMPNMDGMETLRSIRSNKKLKDLKIMMCTSESEKMKIIEAVKSGANNYIVKPFTIDVLKDKLQGLGIL